MAIYLVTEGDACVDTKKARGPAVLAPAAACTHRLLAVAGYEA